MRKLILIPLLILCAGIALGQSKRTDIEKMPGYFSFGDIQEFADGEEMIEVDLMQPLLGIFSGVMASEEPELARLVENLELVNVRVFSYERSVEGKLRDHMEKISDRLRKDDWENIIRARTAEEHVNIFVKLSNAKRGEPAGDNTAVEGLAILVLEDDQAVFANVVGHFGMSEISSLGAHFNIPHVGDLDHRSGGDDDEENDGWR